MDAILAEEQAIAAAAAQAAASRGGANSASGRQAAESVRRSLESTILMKQLLEMGFPPNWCTKVSGWGVQQYIATTSFLRLLITICFVMFFLLVSSA